VRILTCKQVAELLQAKLSTVYAWAEQGIVPCVKLNGLLRFDEDEILQWIKACKRPERCYTRSIQARGPKRGGKQ
jgi:excisionase family DNA binding protein